MKHIIKYIVNILIKVYLMFKASLIKKNKILFFGFSPMNYTMFKPIHKEIERISKTKVVLSFTDKDVNLNEYQKLGVNNILPMEIAIKKIWDAIILCDFEAGRFRWTSNFIQIYHGVAAKKYSYIDSKGSEKFGDFRNHHTLPLYDIIFFINNIDYKNAILNNNIKKGAKSYVSGMCCLDELKNNCKPENIKKIKEKYIPVEYKNRNVILYAPTWDDYSSYCRIGDKILNNLTSYNAFIIIKPHPNCLRNNIGKTNYDLKTFIKMEFKYNNYAIITDTPYEVMAISDLMITDFSSIALEYTLLRKPIYFFLGKDTKNNVCDYEQLDLLIKSSTIFYEDQDISNILFDVSSFNNENIKYMDIIQDKYFPKYGNSTREIIDKLILNKIIIK